MSEWDENLSELRLPSVKVARPAQISGGGAGGGKNRVTFPLSQNSNFARKNSDVGTPTKSFLVV
ncbi:hypothetical protein A0128_04385 [Leptospira tipperaryensis]|uniref:Uncharacterized protein n=1 Tax=Leptospira tipperaryensis TaxID=2564040 RepID=A0A1D7UU61_9LEPT|nr:hypothetical protein A0128_04385 [Leptospira tipperaryensis]